MKHQQLNLLFIINSSAVSITSYTKAINETFKKNFTSKRAF